MERCRMCDKSTIADADDGISLYIHIPFCISKCAYCDFFSRPSLNPKSSCIPDEYVNALCNEISFRIQFYKINKVRTVYVGGGTPSLLTEKQLVWLFDEINKYKIPQAEVTVEVNPDDVKPELLKTLRCCGVTRLSCGIQTMNDAALKKACRRADARTNQKALELFNKDWKGELSVDLISGLPEDDEESLQKSLQKVCELNPCHISLYSLTIEENTPFGKQLEKGQLKYDFDAADKLWLSGRDYLEEKGYKWYEVSNFCRPGKECRHNLSYWTHKSYLGCGSGATGTVYYEDGQGFRWTNNCDIEKYIEYWNTEKADRLDGEKLLQQTAEFIDEETSQFEFFMMGLRKLSGFSEKEYRKIFGSPLPKKFLSVFEKWMEKGLCVKELNEDVAEKDCAYSMSRGGILFLNRFLGELC